MISVCIATYNGEKYLKSQLLSILPQLSEEDEIIISDDNSTDGTLQVVELINDPRIMVIHHKHSPSKFTISESTRNFENALAHSRGDIIFLADQDDYWYPNKVEITLNFLRQYDLVMSDANVSDENLCLTGKRYSEMRPMHASILYNIYKPSFLGCCMAFRREVMKKALTISKHKVAHDFWIGCVALRYFRFGYINQPLIIYRRHGSTVTSSGTTKKTSLYFKIRRRLIVIRALSSLYLQ